MNNLMAYCRHPVNTLTWGRSILDPRWTKKITYSPMFTHHIMVLITVYDIEILHSPGPIFQARCDLHSRNSVSAKTGRRWKGLAENLSEDASFGIGTVLVVHNGAWKTAPEECDIPRRVRYLQGIIALDKRCCRYCGTRPMAGKKNVTL